MIMERLGKVDRAAAVGVSQLAGVDPSRQACLTTPMLDPWRWRYNLVDLLFVFAQGVRVTSQAICMSMRHVSRQRLCLLGTVSSSLSFLH